MVKKLLLLFLVFFGCIVFPAIGWSALGGGFAEAAGDYYYNNIDVNIFIKPDSSFDTIEQQTYYLNGNFGYFFRDIELKDLDHISNVLVYDSDGKLLNKKEYDLSYRGNKLHIQWNFPRRDFSGELKSWSIKYTVYGGLRFFDDYDELYWNAIFPDRDVPVKNAKATVHLPRNADFQALSYIGKPGNDKVIYDYNKIDGNTAEFEEKDINPGEFLTVSVSFPKDIVKKPFLYRDQIIALTTILIALIIPIVVFVKAFTEWRKKGKDTKINRTIIAQYEPPAFAKSYGEAKPDNLAPALIGVLTKQKITLKEILATVINLAIKGYLVIKEEKRGFSVFKTKEYVFEKKKDFSDLKGFEKRTLSGLFRKGDIVSTSDLKNEFYKEIEGIKKEIYKEVATTELFKENIEKTRKKYAVKYLITAAISAFIFVGLIIFTGTMGLDPIYTVCTVIIGISAIISTIIGLIFAYYMPVLTEKGAETKWKALGFKEYLHTAERFRIGAQTLETFSLFLPYAMVFGVEKEWAKRFADFEYRQQGWYYPAAVYSGQEGMPSSFSEFSSGLSSFSSAIASSFSPPGGSGASGAGGAGGGGGGGGGGAG